jgi:hypothetical protein
LEARFDVASEGLSLRSTPIHSEPGRFTAARWSWPDFHRHLVELDVEGLVWGRPIGVFDPLAEPDRFEIHVGVVPRRAVAWEHRNAQTRSDLAIELLEILSET